MVQGTDLELSVRAARVKTASLFAWRWKFDIVCWSLQSDGGRRLVLVVVYPTAETIPESIPFWLYDQSLDWRFPKQQLGIT